MAYYGVQCGLVYGKYGLLFYACCMLHVKEYAYAISLIFRCMDCGNSYHDKCADSVPKNCTKYKAVEGVQQTLNRSQGDNGSIASSANTGQTSSQHFYEQFSSNVAENRTHEG